jgi:hypothetical protein
LRFGNHRRLVLAQQQAFANQAADLPFQRPRVPVLGGRFLHVPLAGLGVGGVTVWQQRCAKCAREIVIGPGAATGKAGLVRTACDGLA